ncbi:hypothetical protein C8A01DRAFT_12786 [Parachaetomium inaequale]|uniref:Uncharacterized protein n=1 Tax=Parachaetomium inaequale TaxID=2588326 RepID=A0AAN6PR12_9PEZI|nr:hypothetical protein C8A01DRAFT_12786 [Parachaetomium inaequale]
MAPAITHLLSRQSENCQFTEDGYLDENSCYVPFWSTRTGTIVKWSLFLGIIVAIGLYLLLGYMHAQRRMKKGLPPLGYHRFLVSRAALAQVDPRYRPPQPSNIYRYTPEQHYYDMNTMPPPVYDPNAPRPPMYEPPAGSTKIEPNQQQQQQQPQGAQQSQPPTEGRVEYGPPPGSPPPRAPGQPQDTYAPPPGPPPSTVRPQGTGTSNPFRD